eukprot:g62582.t1
MNELVHSHVLVRVNRVTNKSQSTPQYRKKSTGKILNMQFGHDGKLSRPADSPSTVLEAWKELSPHPLPFGILQSSLDSAQVCFRHMYYSNPHSIFDFLLAGFSDSEAEALASRLTLPVTAAKATLSKVPTTSFNFANS